MDRKGNILAGENKLSSLGFDCLIIIVRLTNKKSYQERWLYISERYLDVLATNPKVFHGNAVRRSLKVKYSEIVLVGVSLVYVLGRLLRQRK